MKNSDDHLVMALLFADRALNAWDYLKPRVKEVITTLDETAKYMMPKADIFKPEVQTEWWS